MKSQLIAKLIALFFVLGATQMLFAYWTGYKDEPSTVRELKAALADNARVLYLGDSTLYRGDPTESDQRTLPRMLGDALPDHRVAGIYHDAYHLELLEHFCRYATLSENKPEVIIFPINMRSFSDERVKRPEYQFVRETLFLKNSGTLFASFYRPLAVFKIFDLEPITQEEYLDLAAYDGAERLASFREIRSMPYEKVLPMYLRMCYRYQLSEEHPHVQALGRIAEMCRDGGITLIPYSTPTDYQRGDAIIGTDFSEGIRANLDVIESVLKKYDVDLLNLTFAFEKESFAHDEYPDAYIRSAEKLYVAQQLEDIIRGVD